MSIRLAWHSDGWNGHICKKSCENVYCIGQHSYPGQLVAETRDLEFEMANGIGFFIFTFIIQALLAKIRKNGNKGTTAVWVGANAIIIICIVGIITKNVSYLAAVLGIIIIMADEIGQAVGWH